MVLYGEWDGNVWKSLQVVKHRSVKSNFDQLVFSHGCSFIT